MRRRFQFTLSALAAVSGAFFSVPAGAAHPTTAECLAASDASLASGNQHKLRAERVQLLVCAAASCPADIRKECVSRVEAVNSRIPTIVFDVKDASGADLGAVKVTMNGELLAERLEGTALSVDPGEQAFVFEAEGQPTVTRKFLIREAEKERHEVVVLGTPKTAAIPPPPPNAVVPPPPENPESPAEAPARRGMGTQRIVALVAGSVGVVGIGVGTAFGVVAMSKKSDAQKSCPGSACTTQDGVDAWSTATTTGNISTIGFIVGGVGLAGAAALWFTAPRASNTQVGFGPGVLQVKGTW